MYQLWERVVHHQNRAEASKNFDPMGTQAAELSTKNHVFVTKDTLKFVNYVFVLTNIPNMFRHLFSVYTQTVSVSVSDKKRCALKRRRWDGILSFFHRTSRHNHLKKIQLDAQVIICIFLHPLYVSGGI